MFKAVLAFIFFSLFSLNAHAVSVHIYGKNSELLFQAQIEMSLPSNVGQATVLAFDSGSVPYEGGTYGIKKIYDLSQDIEVVSDKEMKAYGWCFSIDGLVPETMPDQTSLISSDSRIDWFYAYAHYKDGQWIGQCVRSSTNDY